MNDRNFEAVLKYDFADNHPFIHMVIELGANPFVIVGMSIGYAALIVLYKIYRASGGKRK